MDLGWWRVGLVPALMEEAQWGLRRTPRPRSEVAVDLAYLVGWSGLVEKREPG